MWCGVVWCGVVWCGVGVVVVVLDAVVHTVCMSIPMEDELAKYPTASTGTQ